MIMSVCHVAAGTCAFFGSGKPRQRHVLFGLLSPSCAVAAVPISRSDMEPSVGLDSAVIGLGGGAGERVVQELLEAEPSLRAVVVDQNEDAGLSAADVSVEFVGVWHGGLDIRTLIQQGEYGDAATA